MTTQTTDKQKRTPITYDALVDMRNALVEAVNEWPRLTKKLEGHISDEEIICAVNEYDQDKATIKTLKEAALAIEESWHYENARSEALSRLAEKSRRGYTVEAMELDKKTAKESLEKIEAAKRLIRKVNQDSIIRALSEGGK